MAQIWMAQIWMAQICRTGRSRDDLLFDYGDNCGLNLLGLCELTEDG
jgi:hypothetical protein